jgi:hypothetical protein
MIEILVFLLKAIAGKVISDEVVSGTVGLARWIVKLSASHLCGSQRERYEEEWLANLADRPTAIRKLLFAADCMRAACVMRHHYLYDDLPIVDRIVIRILDLCAALLVAVIVAPYLIISFAGVWASQHFRGPFLTNVHRRRDGRKFYSEAGIAFRTYLNGGQTSIGKVLAITGIEMLPTIWRVIQGRSSLVGRRPLYLELEAAEPHDDDMPYLEFIPDSDNVSVLRFLKRSQDCLRSRTKTGKRRRLESFLCASISGCSFEV